MSYSFNLRLFVVAFLAPFLMSTLPAQAQKVVDQANEVGNNMRSEDFFEPVGQSFTPTISWIDFVDLRLSDTSTATVSHTVRVDIRQATIDGPILGSSSTMNLPDCFNQSEGPGCGIGGGTTVEVRLDFPAPMSLTPGNLYVMEIVATGDIGVHYQDRNNPYSAGTAIFDGMARSDLDLWFREGATVPEPSTVALLIAGFVGLSTYRALGRK